jgi:primary-amine oxidase
MALRPDAADGRSGLTPRLGRTTAGTLVAALLAAAVVAGVQPPEAPPPAPGSGHREEWRGWQFRWSIRPREGLVLTDVFYQGREVLGYAGLAEIYVPYHPGQPRPEDFQDGVGLNLAELLPGHDCLPGTVCRMVGADGRPSQRPLVGIHEESTGLLYLGEMGRAYGRMLVLWCASRLGGYTYFLRWRFRDDGVLLPEVGLTGRLEHTGGNPLGPRGTIVAREPVQVHAPAHVHNFYFRLDFNIDGADNDEVQEFSHLQDIPGRSAGATDRWTTIPRESVRSLDAQAFRSWRVADRVSTNANGLPRSYELHPGGNGVFRGHSAEPFAQGDLWVLRHRRNEHPFSQTDPRPLRHALPAYLNGEDVLGRDVVLYYSLHAHHQPRSEDWPAMPVVWEGFTLAPRDFLDRSPLTPGDPLAAE